jgi:nucleotide-binding universal stress UspA family protein
VSTILIGVDDSARSEDAVAFGRRLAIASGARVVLACAFPYESPGLPRAPVHRDRLREPAEETLDRLRDGLNGVPDERVSLRAVGGYSPARVLHELAESEDPGIVIVGSTHTGHLGRVRPGSTGERLLHGAPCPVAVVPLDYRLRADEPLRTVGVAIDGSAEAQAALAAGVDLAGALEAHLEVIGVHSADGYGAPALMGGPGYYTMRKDIERRQREWLASAMATLPAGADAAPVALAGDPARLLIDRSGALDLLIVGSRGYGPLHSVLIGGLSGPVVRDAHCPVIALPRGVATPLRTCSLRPPRPPEMSAPITAAYDSFHEDRAPVLLALAAAELTNAPVPASAVAPNVLVQGWGDSEPIHAEIVGHTQRALRALHAGVGLEPDALFGEAADGAAATA